MSLRVLVIIPAYNEEDSILATVQSVVACGYDYVVVNDGSTDKTLSVCRDNALSVIDLPQNLGIGGAVQTGHKWAQRHGYDVDDQIDGDGQHDPTFIAPLIKKIGLIGQNVCPCWGHRRRSMPLFHSFKFRARF